MTFSRLLVCALMGLSTTAVFAAGDEFAADYSENVLGMLHEYVPAGAANVSVSLVPSANTQTDSSANGTQYNQESKAVTNASVSAAYGLVDRLRIELDESYLISSKTDSTSQPGGTTTTYKSSGLSDPQLSLLWRALEDPAHGMFVDTSVGYTPATMRAKAETATQSGNKADGGSGEFINLTAFWQSGAHEVSFGLNLELDQAAKVTSDTRTDCWSRSPTTYYALQSAYRWHSTPRVFLEPTLDYEIESTTRRTYFNRIPVDSVAAHVASVWRPGISVGMLARPDLVVRVAAYHFDYTRVNTDSLNTTPYDARVSNTYLDLVATKRF